MKLNLCIFQTFVVGCLSAVMTEYKPIQEDGDVSDLDMLHCQLRANGNLSCAIRFDTAVTNGILEERERCEQLSLDWCMSGSMDPGYTYVGKSAVVYTPPFTFYHYHSSNPSWEIWETIPIAIKQGAQTSVQFTAVRTWTEIRISYKNAGGTDIYTKYLWPDVEIHSDVVSTVTAVFGATDIVFDVGGVLHPSGEIGTSVMNIRIFQVMFLGEKGNIHRVSYRAAD